MNPENIVESTGATVDDAIAAGLRQLSASPFEVIVEVLDEGSIDTGGLTARPARVRLKRLAPPSPSDFASQTTISSPPPEETPISFPVSKPEAPERVREDRPQNRERSRDRGSRDRNQGGRDFNDRRRERPAQSSPLDDLPYPSEEETDAGNLALLYETVEVPDTELDEEAQIGKVVLNELLERMGIRGRIVVRRAKPDDQTGDSPWILDVVGSSDLNRLIGRRGDTLASLQYVTRLITSRELQKRSEVIVDVTGFKAKRARGLHAMALRMADQAVESGRTVVLEPMPPHERRIVHLALRERPDVTTKSIGEGTARKVTISPQSTQD